MSNQTFQGREYRNFPSVLSPAGEVQLPYSGIYHNPGYNPGFGNEGCASATGASVHGYDIGETLAGASGRDKAIRRIMRLPDDADIKRGLFTDDDFTRRVSAAQEEGIMDGSISVNSLDGVVERLNSEQSRSEGAVLITVGTYQMARSFIHGAGIEKYIDALVTSEEAGTGGSKTTELFVKVYERLRENGKSLVDYCDDSKADANAALQASRIVKDRYGNGFTVYLVKKDATDAEVGSIEDGLIVIRSINDKGVAPKASCSEAAYACLTEARLGDADAVAEDATGADCTSDNYESNTAGESHE